MTAPMVLDGPMNGAAFLAYVEQVLVPTLSTGDTVIMDNLPAHKADGVRLAIDPVGGKLLYLPPNSPDFNPIEMAFSNSKPFCGQGPSAPLRPCGIPLAKSSRSSNRRNVPTISQQPDMTRIKMDAL
ncbi:DDE superfamily endonuclease [Rhizobium lusitanum]|uniref:DDE superfamily endonuclease n=1 Tax=Rhizobium lusitanum TaxID=293958 RepID=A0A1C3WE53_9HYPH|nr:DDE superfamily endonuclease [Rhizobium lusitanum]